MWSGRQAQAQAPKARGDVLKGWREKKVFGRKPAAFRAAVIFFRQNLGTESQKRSGKVSGVQKLNEKKKKNEKKGGGGGETGEKN